MEKCIIKCVVVLWENALVHIHLCRRERGKSVLSWCDGSSDRSFMVDSLGYFSFQPVPHAWCKKGRGMCYPVCGMMYIKEPLLLIETSSLCGGSGFPLSLSERFFTICMTPYNRSSQCSTTGATKAVVCVILSVG